MHYRPACLWQALGRTRQTPTASRHLGRERSVVCQRVTGQPKRTYRVTTGRTPLVTPSGNLFIFSRRRSDRWINDGRGIFRREIGWGGSDRRNSLPRRGTDLPATFFSPRLHFLFNTYSIFQSVIVYIYVIPFKYIFVLLDTDHWIKRNDKLRPRI